MTYRIVKMIFRNDEIENFLLLFETVKHKIKNTEGCQHLELWQDKTAKNTLFTFSIWLNEECLENYRKSNLFEETWAHTKIKFEGKPEAWSVEQLVSSAHNNFM